MSVKNKLVQFFSGTNLLGGNLLYAGALAVVLVTVGSLSRCYREDASVSASARVSSVDTTSPRLAIRR